MSRRGFLAVAFGIVLVLPACGGSSSPQSSGGGGGSTPSGGGGSKVVPSPPATSNTISVSIGETDAVTMFLNLSQASATAGEVTFVVTNEGLRKHEFIVMKTDMMAADYPITSHEGETDRIEEDTPGVEVLGEIEEIEPGATQNLVLNLEPGHHVLACNLKGHYRMGMRSDFQVNS
jgi:uncharacterized cupredoxin-like copper-binding protein